MTKPQGGPRSKQNLRLLIALSLLLVALTVVLVKDRDFWFGSDQALEADGGSDGAAQATPVTAPAKSVQAPAIQAQKTQVPATQVAAPQVAATPVAAAKNSSTVTAPTHPAAAVAASKNAASATPSKAVAANAATSHPGAAAASAAPAVVASHRVMLPPLDVEVVAGDAHHTLRPGTNVAKVEIPGDSNRASAGKTSAANVTTNAAEHEALAAVSVADAHQPVDSSFPLLGQHSRVQGSVVLQAVVGADGTIENLRVLSGPSILAAAAQQAVRQWRFKPYLQNGQAVETKTTITVNFSIRVADNPAKS